MDSARSSFIIYLELCSPRCLGGFFVRCHALLPTSLPLVTSAFEQHPREQSGEILEDRLFVHYRLRNYAGHSQPLVY
jgi:hypothetical protein